MILHIEIPDELLDSYEEAFSTSAVWFHNIEEAAEYIHACTRFVRGKDNAIDNVIEEMADLFICQMHLMRLIDKQAEVVAMVKQKQGKAIANIEAKRG